MSSKKSSKEKQLRREIEILKSQVKISNKAVTQNTQRLGVEVNTGKSDKYSLPVNAIKRDLLKTALFAVFSILLLIVLNLANFRALFQR